MGSSAGGAVESLGCLNNTLVRHGFFYFLQNNFYKNQNSVIRIDEEPPSLPVPQGLN